MSRRRPSRVRRAGVAVACAGVLAGGLAAPAAADTASDDGRNFDRASAKGRDHAATRAVLEAIVRDGTPGVVARVDDLGGHWNGSAGVADTDTRRPRLPVDRYRIASITKTFTATVLLQLEAEGRLSLDDPVEKWLPGVVQGNGNDGRRITVAQLLNHTSRIFNYNKDEGFLARFTGEAFLENRFTGVSRDELVAIGMSHAPVQNEWEYSDTNYALAGMVIERVTRSTYAEQIRIRLIEPLGLWGTNLPGASPYLPRPHGRHYSILQNWDPGAPVHDVTEFNPMVAGASGEMISTLRDVNHFFGELLAGRLLPPAQQQKMFAGHVLSDKETYGLGIRSWRLSCGVTVWGHGGMLPGSLSRTVGTADGSHVLSLNRNADWGDEALEERVVETEFCGRG
ncbi:serine hydrolase domain-containing protein [Yinghuangia sp. YIM S10712]|uniref:serine hydrolase domain-containing protein n=1 Tax=Yinghuangia sp. YIM S10712 TaxID=3436930 RepID=UPI003F5355DE